MKPEHIVTVESEQDNPLGSELSPIDPTFVGREVKVTQVKAAPKSHTHSDGCCK
jgi:hypothetical protein